VSEPLEVARRGGIDHRIAPLRAEIFNTNRRRWSPRRREKGSQEELTGWVRGVNSGRLRRKHNGRSGSPTTKSAITPHKKTPLSG